MARTWLYSDPHFYHNNITTFRGYDGERIRPLWDEGDGDTMTEDLIAWYNEMVSDEDRVYMLGDIAFSAKRMRDSVGRMKGRKVLIKGNHDPDKHRDMYNELFDDVRAVVRKNGFVMTHVPLHPQCLDRWGLNIHGHLHANRITNGPLREPYSPIDLRYRCVCVEQTNWRPILLDEVLEERGIKIS